MNEAQAKAQIAELTQDVYGKAFPRLLKIRPKKGPLCGFELNEIQRKVARCRTRFTIVIKPRQDGISTYGNGEGFMRMMRRKGQNILAMNLQKDVTEKMFERVRLFYQEWPEWMRTEPIRDNVQKLQLKHGSSFDAWTIKENMGKEEANKLGRSVTTQFLHGTEVCFWEWYREILNGVLDAITDDGEIFLESTGNGAQGGAYEDFMEIVEKGEPVPVELGVWRWGNRTAIFLAWFENSERQIKDDPFAGESMDSKARYYLKETETEHREAMSPYKLHADVVERCIYWRRAKLKEKGFFRDPIGAIKVVDREFPGTYRHAFQSSGHAFLSLTLTDTLREMWKARNKLNPPMQIGLIEDKSGPKVDTRESWLMVWDVPLSGWKYRYAVGGDVGGGHADGDRDVIWAKDRITNKIVAVAHGTWGPQEFARRLMLVGSWYGAKVSFETNNHGTAVQVKVFEAEYPDVYKYDSNADAYKGLGWLTNEKSRRDGLDHLKLVYEDQSDPLQIPYLEFYTEAGAFAAAPGRTKPEGQGGVHDDLILGLMVTEMNSLSMPLPERIRIEPTYGQNQMGGIKQKAMHGPSNTSNALKNY